MGVNKIFECADNQGEPVMGYLNASWLMLIICMCCVHNCYIVVLILQVYILKYLCLVIICDVLPVKMRCHCLIVLLLFM